MLLEWRLKFPKSKIHLRRPRFGSDDSKSMKHERLLDIGDAAHLESSVLEAENATQLSMYG
jgi:hypothetical protein